MPRWARAQRNALWATGKGTLLRDRNPARTQQGRSRERCRRRGRRRYAGRNTAGAGRQPYRCGVDAAGRAAPARRRYIGMTDLQLGRPMEVFPQRSSARATDQKFRIKPPGSYVRPASMCSPQEKPRKVIPRRRGRRRYAGRNTDVRKRVLPGQVREGERGETRRRGCRKTRI